MCKKIIHPTQHSNFCLVLFFSGVLLCNIWSRMSLSLIKECLKKSHQLIYIYYQCYVVQYLTCKLFPFHSSEIMTDKYPGDAPGEDKTSTDNFIQTHPNTKHLEEPTESKHTSKDQTHQTKVSTDLSSSNSMHKKIYGQMVQPLFKTNVRMRKKNVLVSPLCTFCMSLAQLRGGFHWKL